MTTPVELEQTQVDPAVNEVGSQDLPWLSIVWNDPVNLMSYVTYVFQKLFHKGRAVVSQGSRDKVEIDVAKLHGAGLWATMQRDA